MFNEIRAALALLTARMDREFSELSDRARRTDERIDGLTTRVEKLATQTEAGFERIHAKLVSIQGK
jgi:hypothetical protein